MRITSITVTLRRPHSGRLEGAACILRGPPARASQDDGRDSRACPYWLLR